MTFSLYTVPVLMASYLIGSIAFAVIASRLFGLADPRTYGSGNPGATNVLRSGSKAAAIVTLLGDAAKGWLVVWATKTWGPALGLSELTVAAAAILVFLGHVFSVFLKFKGGKGVATAAGVLFGIHPLIGLSTLGVWLLTAFITRYSSLAALVAALCGPIFCYLFTGSVLWAGTALIIAAILIWRHEANIRRLLNGTEGKLGKKK